jgi:CRP-like cAMP-binding protein
MAYSDLYLRRKGIDTGEILDIFISHNHGDHDQGVYNYLINGRKLRLIGSPVVVEQTLIKVAAAVDVALDEIRRIVDTCIIPVGEERRLPGYDGIFVTLAYTIHSIPCNMIKFRYRDQNGALIKTLGYSGDTLFDPAQFPVWVREGKLDQAFIDTQLEFFRDVDVLIHEAGGGTIHSHMQAVAAHYPQVELYWVHTALENAAFGKKILQAGDQVTLLPEMAGKKIEWYIKLFEQVPLFSRFSHEENYRLAKMAADGRRMEIITYMAGEEIFRQGEDPRDDSFFVIAQGAIDVFQDENFVASLGIGQQLGEMAIFGNNRGKRNATVKAFSGVKLVRIEREAYEEFLKKIDSAYQNYAEARPALEASNSPFRSLNHNILDNIAARMEKQVFERNPDGSRSILITKDMPHNNALYLIMEGEVGAIVDKDKRVGFKLGKGSVIGEMSLLDPTNRPSATVIAISERVVTFTLSRAAFNEIIEKYPPVRYILEGISRKRRQVNEQALHGKG